MRTYDWKYIYPDIYMSYMAGAYVTKSKDGKPHAHVLLRQNSENNGAGGVYNEKNGGIGCLACKTSDINRLYEAYGDDVWTMKYADIKDEFIKDLYWDCYICHQNDPENFTGAVSISWLVMAKDFNDTLSPSESACGQCHSIIGGYTRRLVRGESTVPNQTINDLDPYRYGLDPYGLYKAFMEDGDALVVDKDGVENFWAGHPDIEIYQGSNHQRQGLECGSCHMPEVTTVNGEKYVWHGASYSPLENQAALQFCLTCHKSKGIEDTKAMVEFVRGKQAELKAMSDEVTALLEELHGLIVAGGLDAVKDREARDLYIMARWVRVYSDGTDMIRGAKAPLNYDLMAQYYKEAKELALEGIALFK